MNRTMMKKFNARRKGLTHSLSLRVFVANLATKTLRLKVRIGDLTLWFALFLLLGVSACKVSQPYKSPTQIVNNDLYRGVQTSDSSTIATIPWEQFFADTLLQSLIREGLNNNPDMTVAFARIKQAEANLAQSKAAFLPTLDANAGVTTQKLSATQLGRTQIQQVNLSAGWEADLWGKLSSAKRAALASLLQSEANQRVVQTQLIANIAANYFRLMAFDAQLKITLQTLEVQKNDVDLMQTLKASDVVTGADVAQSEANRYSVEIVIPDLKQSIRETENTVCILVGRSPGEIVRDSLSNENLKDDLKTGVPLQLLANRPDVQASEYQLRNSSELVNVARAYFYPSLVITAQGGWVSSNFSTLFNPASLFGTVVGGLTQPILANGQNKQRLRIAQAQVESDLASFRQTLLNAGGEVSNALYSYQTAADKIQIRSQQIAYLDKSVEFLKELVKYTSNTNYTDVLTSEQNLLSAQLNGVGDKLQQLQSIISLYVSLGGGTR